MKLSKAEFNLLVSNLDAIPKHSHFEEPDISNMDELSGPMELKVLEAEVLYDNICRYYKDYNRVQDTISSRYLSARKFMFEFIIVLRATQIVDSFGKRVLPMLKFEDEGERNLVVAILISSKKFKEFYSEIINLPFGDKIQKSLRHVRSLISETNYGQFIQEQKTENTPAETSASTSTTNVEESTDECVFSPR